MVTYFTMPSSTTTTTRLPVSIQSGTIPRPEASDDPASPEQASEQVASRSVGTGETLPKITDKEKGSNRDLDAALEIRPASLLSSKPENDLTDKRIASAKTLKELLKRTLKSAGKVQIMGDVQLIKRELSRCHDHFRNSRAEADFLSIVVLIESCLASIDPKQLTQNQLRAISTTLDHSLNSTRVTFDDYNKAQKVIRGAMLRTGPTFELDLSEETGAGEQQDDNDEKDGD